MTDVSVDVFTDNNGVQYLVFRHYHYIAVTPRYARDGTIITVDGR